MLDEIKRLQADRAHQDARWTFFVEGVRNVVQAIENGFRIETLVSSDQLLTVPIARKLVCDRRRSDTPNLHVSSETFRQVSTTYRASGVGAIVTQRWSPLHGASPRAGLCWVVLEAVRSEGDLGTLIRTSEAIGGAGFILVGSRIDPFDLGIVRASMGALFRQAFIRTNDRSLRHRLCRHRCRVVGASPDGSAELHRFDSPSFSQSLKKVPPMLGILAKSSKDEKIVLFHASRSIIFRYLQLSDLQSEVPTYLPQAIVAIVLLFLPVGVFALRHALLAKGFLAQGDTAGARVEAQKAKRLCLVSASIAGEIYGFGLLGWVYLALAS